MTINIAALEARVADLAEQNAAQAQAIVNANALIAQLALIVAGMHAAMSESAERLPGERVERAETRVH